MDDAHNTTLVADEFKKAVEDYELPEGYSVEFSGETESINEAMGQLLQLLGLGIVIMYLIMVAQFQNLLSPFIVMFTVPLAFTGGFLGLLLTGNILSVIAMVGFVMLCGIIVNNGIVFIDYTNQLRQEGMSKIEALVETGRTRMRPILHDCADNDSCHVHDGSRVWRWKRYGSADGDRNDRRYDLWNLPDLVCRTGHLRYI